MQITFNTSSFLISEVDSTLNGEDYNLSNAIIDLQNINTPEIGNSGATSFSSSTIAEKRRILQRALNLQDAAQTLSSHLKSNRNNLSGNLASDTSTEALEISFGEEENIISAVSGLSELTSGTFQINGKVINIDTSTDSLLDVIDRVNSSESGVQLSYDYAEQELTVSSLNHHQILLNDGSSNFFSALNLHEGYISGDQSNSEEAIATDADTQRYFKRFAARFNRLLQSDFSRAGEETFKETLINAAQNSIQTFIDSSFTSGETRLASNVLMTINSQTAQFGSTEVSFENNDSPSQFLNFLTSPQGLVSPFTSLTNNKNEQLKESLRTNNSNGVIISTQI